MTAWARNLAVRAGLLVMISGTTLVACDQPKAETPADTPAAVEPAATPAAAEPATTPSPAVQPAPIPMSGPFLKETGFAWTMTAPLDPDVRKLRIFEDGKELGPADSIHDDIRNLGLGRYSHWKSTDGSLSLYFSTSDNSDPNTNGKTYELR